MIQAKIPMDTELLLRWAFQDELSKRKTSSAEGIWDRILEDGQARRDRRRPQRGAGVSRRRGRPRTGHATC
jgi:hypothetical protein